MRFGQAIQAFGALVHKDLVCELRLGRAWPAMLLLGLTLVFLLQTQVDLPGADRRDVTAGLLWLDVFFAGTLVLERSFAAEREEGCWRALRTYPLPPTVLYLAKVTGNVIALLLLQVVLVPALALFAGVPLLARPAALAAVFLLADVALASLGALVSALTAGASVRGNLLPILLLPLALPVVLAAAQGTRALAAGDAAGPAALWAQVLLLSAVSFPALGILLFGYLVED